MKPKRIQVEQSFLNKVNELMGRLAGMELDHVTEELCREIQISINDKQEAIFRRKLYTWSKVAEKEEDKEFFRQKYLDEVGMKSSFRR